MSSPSFSRWRRIVWRYVPVVFAAYAFGACKKAVVEVATPGSLVLVQGNNQQVQGGGELPNPVVLRIVGTDGKPVVKFPVGFSVVQGGGSVNPGSPLSDESGEVKVKWTVGPNEVAQLLRATVPGVDAVNVAAIALLPSDIIIAQGNNQSAKVSGPLPNPIVIRIVGPGNVPMKGIAVAFQVIAGGGLISPQSALTNALGEVTVRWTMGATAGTNTLAVSSGALQPLAMSAISQ